MKILIDLNELNLSTINMYSFLLTLGNSKTRRILNYLHIDDMEQLLKNIYNNKETLSIEELNNFIINNK